MAAGQVTPDGASGGRPGPGLHHAALGWVDLLLCAALVIGGFVLLRDAPHWGRNAYVGSAQFGDAEFWWNGALHFSHGIVAENPNIAYRMGYAAFAGLVAAVFGPDYRIFHQVLLVVFLATVCGLYVCFRPLIGRIASAALAVSLVFNPFTAEWLAMSTSDGLGLTLNLAAVLALMVGVRDGLRLGWVGAFGVLLACGSLTRPLMTPFIVPAALAVIAAGWRQWRSVGVALAVMLAAFVAPTLGWMGFMKATTGNFALTGASQDSSAFYAASDPQIQVWRGDMYPGVVESAKKRFQTDEPSAPQINSEFWRLTEENYRRHWQFHVARLWRHTYEIARFTPARSTPSTPETERKRTVGKWILVAALTAAALWRRRWMGATTVAVLGATWAAPLALHPWAVLVASSLGLAGLLVGNRPGFIWAAYWWVGLLALYLTGGTWGPPIGPTHDLNALGYRLGFQIFFVGDLLVIFCLGWMAQWQPRPAVIVTDGVGGWLMGPSPLAARLGRIVTMAAAAGLAVILVVGGAKVTWRLVARARAQPVPYPAIAALAPVGAVREARPAISLHELTKGLEQHTGAPFVTTAMSSGFIWNLPRQERAILLLYQQNLVHPVKMNPGRFDVEVSQHLPARTWMNRQGAWVVRSFPDTAQTSHLPYYLEMPIVQAFVPLAADGQSYDLSHATVFPLAKYATQLAAAGELDFRGRKPEWSLNSGSRPFARRFALRCNEASAGPVEFELDSRHARGKKTFKFGVQLESAGRGQPGVPPVQMQIVPTAGQSGPPLWQASLAAPSPDVTPATISLDAGVESIRFTAENLQPGEALWFYELVLTADDFTQ